MGRPTPWEPPAEPRVRRIPVSSDRPSGVRRGRRAEITRKAAKMSENASEVTAKTPGSDAEADGGAAGAVHVAGNCGAVDGGTVLDRYFALSDTAGKERKDFEELVSLFSPRARIASGRGEDVEGIDAVRAFYREFFDRNLELHHVWKTKVEPDGLHIARWAVAGRRISGEVFALSGCDTAETDDAGRIAKLRVKID